MKFIKSCISFAVISTFLLLSLACGGSSTTSSNNTNQAGNSAGSKPKDTSPVTVEAKELSEKEHLGREVTVTGGMLHRIEPDKVRVSVSGGGYITCIGSFSSYMESSSRVKELADKNDAPTVTIKGTYKKYDGGAVIDPCVMTDFTK